jgi:hypothetical protein
VGRVVARSNQEIARGSRRVSKQTVYPPDAYVVPRLNTGRCRPAVVVVAQHTGVPISRTWRLEPPRRLLLDAYTLPEPRLVLCLPPPVNSVLLLEEPPLII